MSSEVERPLLVKDRIMDEKWPVNLACDSDSRVNHRVLLRAANLRHGQAALLPLQRKACCGFFRLKNPMASARFKHHTTRPRTYLLYQRLPMQLSDDGQEMHETCRVTTMKT
jgi:hypothetical protein